MNDQLERDFSRKLYERIQKACKDHLELCEAAGMDPKDAISIILAVMGSLLTKAIAELTPITPEHWGETMAKTLRSVLAKKKASA